MAYLSPQTLTGCFANYATTYEIATGTYIDNLSLTVREGYQFKDDDSAIQLGPWTGYSRSTVKWYSDSGKTKELNLTSNKPSACKTIYAGRFGFTSGNNIALTCTCEVKQVQQCGLTPQVLSNCTCDISPDARYDKNSTIYPSITANEGFSWWYVPANVLINSSGMDTWAWYIDQELKTRVTESNIRGVTKLYTSLQFTSGNDVKLTATASQVNILQTLSFCTSNFPNNPLPNDSVTVTLAADSGYVFKSAPTADVPDGRGGTKNLTAEITENKQSAIFPAFTIYNTTQQYIIRGTAEPDESITDIYPFISVYAPTDDQLLELSKKRFYKISGGTGETVDLGQYVINLIKVYAPVKTGLPTSIKLWDYDTQVTSNVVTEQQVTADLGVAKLDNFENAAYVLNSRLSIYLPFLGVQDLDIRTFLTPTNDNQIHCLYHIDILTGDCTIEITDKQNYTIYTFECNVSIQIPYILSNYNIAYRGDVKTNSKAFISKTPYLILQKPSAIYTNYGYKSATGYLKPIDMPNNFISASHASFRFVALKQEYEEILQILSQGIQVPSDSEIKELTT